MVYTAHSCFQQCCVDSSRKLLHWHFQRPQTRPCQSDTSLSDGYSYTLQKPQKKNWRSKTIEVKLFRFMLLQQLRISVNQKVYPILQYKSSHNKTRTNQSGLTLAGVSVASFSRSPRKVMVEILTLLTVQTLGVMVAHAVTMDLGIQHKLFALSLHCVIYQICWVPWILMWTDAIEINQTEYNQ